MSIKLTYSEPSEPAGMALIVRAHKSLIISVLILMQKTCISKSDGREAETCLSEHVQEITYPARVFTVTLNAARMNTSSRHRIGHPVVVVGHRIGAAVDQVEQPLHLLHRIPYVTQPCLLHSLQ